MLCKNAVPAAAVPPRGEGGRAAKDCHPIFACPSDGLLGSAHSRLRKANNVGLNLSLGRELLRHCGIVMPPLMPPELLVWLHVQRHPDTTVACR